MMNEINQTDNDKWQLNRKPSIAEVDKLAKELCTEYDNFGFYRWYCLVINVLGVQRAKDIQSRCSDAVNKGALFSRYASEEAKNKVGIDKYESLKSKYGSRKNLK